MKRNKQLRHWYCHQRITQISCKKIKLSYSRFCRNGLTHFCKCFGKFFDPQHSKHANSLISCNHGNHSNRNHGNPLLRMATPPKKLSISQEPKKVSTQLEVEEPKEGIEETSQTGKIG